MAHYHEVATLYNPLSHPYRDTSAGVEIDNCLRDAKTYKLRYCENEVTTSLQLLDQGLTPAQIAQHICGLRGVQHENS